MNGAVPEIRPTAGAALSAARLRARKSLDEVSLATRVPVALLEAIERDAWEILPAMAYARGFVRAYAEAVTLDPQVPLSLLAAELARREGEVEAARVVGERRVRFDRLRFRIAYGAAIAVLITVILGALFSITPQTLEARHLDAGSTPARWPASP